MKFICFAMLLLYSALSFSTELQTNVIAVSNSVSTVLVPATGEVAVNTKELDSDSLSPELLAVKKQFPWINKRWFHEKSPKTGRVFAEVFSDFIIAESQKPLKCRGIGTDDELFETGCYIPYDPAVEKILMTLAEKYEVSGEEGLKIADLGCGIGLLSIFMAFITDGTKPLTIFCVDAIEMNITLLIENYKVFSKSFPFKNVFYKKMQKNLRICLQQILLAKLRIILLIILLWQMFFILCLYNQKAAILSHIHQLLKPDGCTIFTHMEINTSYIIDVRGAFGMTYPPGLYRSKILLLNNGDRKEIPGSLEKCEDNDFWKNVSMQAIVVEAKPGEYKKLCLPEIRSLIPTIPDGQGMPVHQVMEVVSQESLTAKCLHAELRAQEFMEYNFDDTSFLCKGLRDNKAASFLVVAIKSVQE